MTDEYTFTELLRILTDIDTAVTRLQRQFGKLKQLRDSDEPIVSPDIKKWLEAETGGLLKLLKDLE